MKKSELKTGMIVETKGAGLAIIIGEAVVTFYKGGLNLSEYDKNLNAKESDYSIYKVWREVDYGEGSGMEWKMRNPKYLKGKLIWRRFIPEYTMEEAIERMGHEFKIKE